MMRKKWIAGLLAGLMAIPMAASGTFAAPDDGVGYGIPGVDYVDGEVIVCVNGGKEALSRADGP